MIKLKNILFEQLQSTPETIEQIWDGNVLPYGARDTVPNGVVRQIQTALVDKLKQLGNPTFEPNGIFGPTTANGIVTVLGIKVSDVTTLTIGPKILTSLGFTKPESLPLPIKVLAATIAGEGVGDKNDMLAIANVILNRSIAKKMKPHEIVLEPKQFSVWNRIVGSDLLDKTNNVIANWAGGLKNSGNIGYWKHAVKLAKSVQQGTLTDNTGGATHYFTGPRPYWATPAKGYIKHAVIGAHEYGRDTSIDWAKNPIKR
jgi:hypothetical protein